MKTSEFKKHIEDAGYSVSDLIVKLNQSREEFAPYAVAWKAQVEADDE